MSDDQQDKQFWELADSFIHLANEHVENVPRSRVSAALLYAAARFNSFVVTANSNSKAQLSEEKEAAILYFVEQYEKMLRENIEDQLANYEKYTR